MRRILTAGIAAVAIGAAILAAPSLARASCWGYWENRQCSAGGELALPLELLSSAIYGTRFSAYFGYGYPAFAHAPTYDSRTDVPRRYYPRTVTKP